MPVPGAEMLELLVSTQPQMILNRSKQESLRLEHAEGLVPTLCGLNRLERQAGLIESLHPSRFALLYRQEDS